MRTRSKPLTLVTSATIALGTLLLPTSSRAQTYTVHSGYDLFTTDASSTYFTGPNNAQIPFKGDPIHTYQFPGFSTPSNVEQTDTIMHRLDSVTGSSSNNFSGSTPIQLVALQLESQIQVPVMVNGVMTTQYIFATLANPTTNPSLGTMDIYFNNNQGGTWDATFNVNLNLHAGSLTGPIVNSQFGSPSGPISFTLSTSDDTWSRTPPTGAVEINGINHNLNGSGDSSQDFWPTGTTMHSSNGAFHHGVSAAVPEASTLLGFGGLVTFSGLCLVRKRGK